MVRRQPLRAPGPCPGCPLPPIRCSRSSPAQVPVRGGPGRRLQGEEAAHSRALHTAGSSPHTRLLRREGGRVRVGGSADTRGLTCWGSNTRRRPPSEGAVTLWWPAGLRSSSPHRQQSRKPPAPPASPRPPQSLGVLGPPWRSPTCLTLGCFRAAAHLGASPLLPAQPLQRPQASKGHWAAPPASEPASVRAAGVHLPTRRPPGASGSAGSPTPSSPGVPPAASGNQGDSSAPAGLTATSRSREAESSAARLAGTLPAGHSPR